MDTLFTFTDLQYLVAIKLLFFVFMGLGILGIYKKCKAGYFVLCAALTSAAAYFLLVDNLELMFWGLKADEQTIAAMFQQFAHGSLSSDFNYAGFVPFYPSLFFQVFGFIGRLFDFNGIQIAKVSALSTIALFPTILYGLQKMYWKTSKKVSSLTWMFSTLFVFIFAGWDAVITKPYELISATLVILWTAFLLRDLYSEKLTTSRAIVYGIVGGMLFWMFYFWFFLAAIGVALFNLFQKTPRVEIRHYSQLFLVGIVTLIVASPFWAPLARTYALHGAENWQLGFFTVEWIATYIPEISFSLKGFGMVAGLVALLWYRKALYIRGLLSLFVAGLLWQGMGLFTILNFGSPLQESKGFLFWSTSIFALAAAYGLEQIYTAHKDKIKEHTRSLALVALLLVGPQLAFGTFVDNEDVYEVRSRARAVEPEMKKLITYLDVHYNMFERVTLTTGIPQLQAFIPMNEFIYFNQHNSHPAAHFSDRFSFLEELSYSSSSAQFYDKIRGSEFDPIELFVFYKGEEDDDTYKIYFNVDAFPHRMEEKVIELPKHVFESDLFSVQYENFGYIVFEPKPDVEL